MLRRFFSLALLTIGTLPLVAHEGHVILATRSTETVVVYGSGHKATWKAEVIDRVNKIIKYTLTLERPASDLDNEPISLYNLRLQGRLWTVRIESAEPGCISFYSTLADAQKKQNAIEKKPDGWTIPQASGDASQGDVDAKPEKVAMMRWNRDGTGKDNNCTIVVYSSRKIRGPLSKFESNEDERDRHKRENHHSEPPPGTPGGEEGESSNKE